MNPARRSSVHRRQFSDPGCNRCPQFANGSRNNAGVLVLDHETTRAMGVSQAQIDAIVEAEQTELSRREADYRQGRPSLDLSNRDVILVDDGLATGSTMRAAIAAARLLKP